MTTLRRISEQSSFWWRIFYLTNKPFFSNCNNKRHVVLPANTFRLSEEVKDALVAKKPVVALESTIITHGMPYPSNLSTAEEVEQVIRTNGAIPATIAIINGVLSVGLTKLELEYLADPKTKVAKTSRRDMPIIMAKKWNGGTTVSGTMLAAHMAGIDIFATGGIGGVHRGAQSSMDISADLTELGRTPVTVVSAGVKSILDIGRTLEYLETQGVCISTYGPTKDFPAFFSSKSGYQAPYNVQSPQEAADVIDKHRVLGLSNGILIAVPIPEENAKEGDSIEEAIHTAVLEAENKGVQGKEVTPFILSRVNDLTKGESLTANIALVKNNATIASLIANELSKKKTEKQLKTNGSVEHKSNKSSPVIFNAKDRKNRVVVVGGSVVDFPARLNVEKFCANGATYPGSVSQSFGGVGRNLADCLSRLNVNPLFVSAIGNDSHRVAYEAFCSHMDLTGVNVIEGERTATYCAILQSSGELLFGIGDMEIHSKITPEFISHFEETLLSASMVCVDGNIPTESIAYILKLCTEHQVPVWFEPTDVIKASKAYCAPRGSVPRPTYASPNLHELRAISCALQGVTEEEEKCGADDIPLKEVLEESIFLCQMVARETPYLILTLGKHGVVVCVSEDARRVQRKNLIQSGDGPFITHYPTVQSAGLVNVSGAGDCLASGIIAGIVEGHDLDLCVRMGLLAAQHSLRSPQAIPASLSRASLHVDEVRKWATMRATPLAAPQAQNIYQ